MKSYADLQVNGFSGVDFSDAGMSAEDFRRAAGLLVETGTVIFLPTIITSSRGLYERNIGIISDVIASEGWGSNIPGVHLEGPFISPEPGAKGCHNSEWVRKPDIDFLDSLGSSVKMITVAAELEGIDELIKHAVSRGIVVSLGHEFAGSADMERAAKAGARALTHLGNAIPQMIDRHRNPIWAGLACDDLAAMIITDGHHLPPELIKVVIKCKGADKVIVTSDSSSIAGLPPGRYRTLGNDVVLEPSGRLGSLQTGQLAGSSATMAQCMGYLESLGLLSKEELEKVGYSNAAKLLGLY